MVNRDKNLRKRIKFRAKTLGTATRPRLSVSKSNKNIYVQAIDDQNCVTLAGVSTQGIEELSKGKVSQAEQVGAVLAKKLKELKVEAAIFDRGPYKYHGRVKSLADSIRAGGIKF